MSARLAVAIVLLCIAGTAAGAELGRLFFTPAQRAALDTLREKNIGTEATAEKPPAPPLPQHVSLDGIVRRSDGKNTVWLNSRAVSEKQTGGINIATGKNDNRVKLTVPESGRSIDLKVGQTAEIVSGTIAESYARRAPLPKPEAKAEPAAGKPAAAAGKTASASEKPASASEKTTSASEEPASASEKSASGAANSARNTPRRTGERDAEGDAPPKRRSQPK